MQTVQPGIEVFKTDRKFRAMNKNPRTILDLCQIAQETLQYLYDCTSLRELFN